MSRVHYYIVTSIVIFFALAPHGRAESLSRVTPTVAEKLIRDFIYKTVPTMAPGIELPVKEITPEDVWDRLGVQVFKVTGGVRECESFLIRDGRVEPIGIGFGGWGVTSIVVTDFDDDKNPEMIYAYSWGSGIHRSCLGFWTTGKKMSPRWSTELVYWNGDFSLRKINDQVVEVVVGAIGRFASKSDSNKAAKLATVDYDKETGKIRIRLAENLTEKQKQELKIIEQPTLEQRQ